jgi:hypothetical protein
MNERIKELVGRAKFMAEEDINKQISYNTELRAFAEKFAELIVRECIDTLGTRQKTSKASPGEYGNGFKSGIAAAALCLQVHFGVEE